MDLDTLVNHRTITVRFMDGTKISFDFPEASDSLQAKQFKLEEFFLGQHLVIEAEGALMVFPVANIKSIEIPISKSEAHMKLPAHTIRDARIIGS